MAGVLEEKHESVEGRVSSTSRGGWILATLIRTEVFSLRWEPLDSCEQRRD